MAKWRSTQGRLLQRAVLVALLVMLLAGIFPVQSQSPVFSPAVDIDQAKLEHGDYPLHKVLESGGQFFSTPYLPYNAETGLGDGYGEGPDGARRRQIRDFYPPGFPEYHFLRLNGLDSQSCYECHNSIGSIVQPGTKTGTLMRTPGSVGGGAGSNSNAFINPSFPDPITFFIRQPPHVFGSGYTQQLAVEIYEDLSRQRGAARVLARRRPGVQQSVALKSKGESYGVFKTTYVAGSPARVVGCDDLCAGETPDNASFGEAGFTDDVRQVRGVACDLIPRPFQWKGISSSIRHFARDAMDFHLSMQAVEKYGDLDCDLDGKRREVSIGNVSALVSFVGMMRPPQQVLPEDPAKLQRVRLGEEIFRGRSTSPALQARLSGEMCATCHRPSMPLEKPKFFVANPGPGPLGTCRTLDAGLVDPVPSHAQLIIFQQVEARVRKVRPQVEALPASSADELDHAIDQALDDLDAAEPLPGYTIDLTRPGVPSEVPAYVYPRLKARPNGSVVVPLFSDLRQHDLGSQLADRGKQGSDVSGICIDRRLFLTRPLWGVADTGPWLHDGRALTLRDAILMHQGDGSDANPVIAAFSALSAEEQQAVVDFLLTLRLPIEQGLTVQEYVDQPEEVKMMRSTKGGR
ncbi:MAG: di-heme oxidoredictase family protein [Thermoanaerobaculia bacterium]